MPAPNPLKRRLTKVMMRPENEICVECEESKPTWAIFVSPPIDSAPVVAAFTCYQCASALRSLGTHILRVKSCHLDVWNEDDLAAVDKTGNKRVNAIFEANGDARKSKPTGKTSLEDRKKFVKRKYEQRKFFDPLGYTEKVGRVTPGGSHSQPQTLAGALQTTHEVLDSIMFESSQHSPADTEVAHIQQLEESLRRKPRRAKGGEKSSPKSSPQSSPSELFGKAVGKTLSKRHPSKPKSERDMTEHSNNSTTEEDYSHPEATDVSAEFARSSSSAPRAFSCHGPEAQPTSWTRFDSTATKPKKKKKHASVVLNGKTLPMSPEIKRSKSHKAPSSTSSKSLSSKSQEDPVVPAKKVRKSPSMTKKKLQSASFSDSPSSIPRKSASSRSKKSSGAKETSPKSSPKTSPKNPPKSKSLSSFKEGVEDLSKQNTARRSRPASRRSNSEQKSPHERESRPQSRRSRPLRTSTSPGALSRHSTGSLRNRGRVGRSASPGALRGRYQNRRNNRQDDLDTSARLVQEGLLLVQQGLAMQEQASPPENISRSSSSGRLKSPRSGRNLRVRSSHHRSPTAPKNDNNDIFHSMLNDLRPAPPLADVGTPLTRRLQRRMSLEQTASIQPSPF